MTKRASEVVGIFARADHPQGWGFAKPGQGGTAHGYVTLFVLCADADQLNAVMTRLYREDFYGLPGSQYGAGALGKWFGGRFDMIATCPPGVDIVTFKGGAQRFLCRGDNRMVAIFTADEVLADG